MKRYIAILLFAMITYRDFYLSFFTFTDTDMMLNENAYIYAYLQEEVYSEL
ncbi:MAG: hypothetical protein LBG59_01160 [Candidatus Peribacteria bacterium]|jgi:hypothetical protein|nr:hypothetical protein [Candidatus Peribacteria bacterium]